MKVYYQNKEKQVEEEMTVMQCLKTQIEKEPIEVIACKINHEVKPLDYILQENDEIELLNVADRDGARIYTRGLLFIMAKAFHEVYPEALLTVNYQLNSSMLCEIYKTIPTIEMIENVKKRMQEIIQRNLPIRKVEMSKEKALAFMEAENTIIGKMQIENMEKEDVSFYFCEEYFNYFYGVMPVSTGYIKIFDIMKYHDGFLIRYPSKKQPNIMEQYKEGKKLLATLDEYEDIYKVLACTR
ncbi:MAG: MoaD/ThiS family protein [Clostridia bacterium]